MSKTKKRTKAKTSPNASRSLLMIGLVTFGAILAVAGLFMMGNNQTARQTEPAEVSQFPAKGEPTAPVTIIEYSDYG